MSTPQGPDRPQGQEPDEPYQQAPAEPYPYQSPQYDPAINLQPPAPEQLPPYAGPQYGAPQYGYPQSVPPARPSNRPQILVATIAVVVVALAVVGAITLTGGDDDKKSARTPPPTPGTAAPAPRSSAAPSSSAAPTSVEQITVPAVISGWKGVLSYKEGVAYDVPPGWKVETPGTLVGFEDKDGKPLAIIHGVSTYKDEACPKVSGSYRGRVGFKTAGDLDPAIAARTGLQVFAKGVALRDDGSSAPISRTTVSDIRVGQGKIRARYARATVTLNDRSDCGSPSVVVVAVAFRSAANATALFIGYFDQGVSDALPLATAQKIFTTLRPYKR